MTSYLLLRLLYAVRHLLKGESDLAVEHIITGGASMYRHPAVMDPHRKLGKISNT
jgi:hypothetical protein